MTANVRRDPRWIAMLSLTLSILAGCAGDYAGEADDNTAVDDTPAGGDHFLTQVQPRLDFCRTCHIPGGVADTEDGHRFLLGANAAGDRDRVYDAWQALGEGVESNLLLLEPSMPAEPHSGGKPWPQGGLAYEAMKVLLQCFEQGSDCITNEDQIPVQERALLGSCRVPEDSVHFAETVEGVIAPTFSSPVSVLGV